MAQLATPSSVHSAFVRFELPAYPWVCAASLVQLVPVPLAVTFPVIWVSMGLYLLFKW